MAINKNFIVSAGLNVGTTANVVTSLAVGSNVVVNTSVITIGSLTINSTSFSGTSNNSLSFGGQLPAFYANADNLTSGTVSYSRIPVNVTNTTSVFTITGNWTFNSNVSFSVGKNIVLSSTSGISANGGFGTGGYVLKTSGSAVYWAVDEQGVTSVASGNGISGGTITTTGTLTVASGNGISVTSGGVNVLAGNNQLISNTSGVWIDQTNIDHNSLSNFDSDKHISHTAVTFSAGNGITGGGTLASNRSFAVLANTGIVANTTGVYVNSAYIATLTSNNATNFNGQAASYYTDIVARLGYTPANIAGGTFTGAITVPSSLTVNAEGTEGGQIVLKKGSSMTTANDVIIDGIGSGLRIYDNNGTTYPQFTFNLGTGSLSSSLGGTFWHTGNDGAGSGLDADLLDGQQGSYYLPSSSYTAADVKSKLLTVDGSGSGIDADLFDGKDSDDFLRNNVDTWFSSADGYQRIHFSNDSHTYIKSPGNVYLRTNNTNTNAFTIDTSGNLTVTGNITGYSDKRLKSEIKNIDNALSIVNNINGYRYIKDNKNGIGVIAQEILEYLPELVHEDEAGYLSVAYGNLTAVLIEAIKELSNKVKQLESK